MVLPLFYLEVIFFGWLLIEFLLRVWSSGSLLGFAAFIQHIICSTKLLKLLQ